MSKFSSSTSFFSDRTEWPDGDNRISVLHQNLKKKGVEITDLTNSNPTQTSLKLPYREMLNTSEKPDLSKYHPDPKGSEEARLAVQRYYQEKNITVSADDILLTPGTSESYLFVLKLLANPHEEVIVQKPGYPLIEMLTHIADVTPVLQTAYCLKSRQAVHPDLNKKAAIKALFTVQPQNPTGAGFSPDDMRVIAQNLRGKMTPVVSDEVFLDFNFGQNPRLCSWASQSDSPVIVLGGISKLLCLPQAKCSWILLCGPDKWKTEAMRRLEILSDCFLSGSPIIQSNVPHWFTFQDQIVETVNERLRRNYSILTDLCDEHPDIEVLSQPAGWSAVLHISHDDEAFAFELLQKTGILINPGYLFDLDEKNCIVISLLTDPEVMQTSLPKLLDFLFSLGK